MGRSVLEDLFSVARPRIFVSYHHGGDLRYYNEFVRIFTGLYEVVEDRSVERLIDSDDAEYVMRKIREDYIRGTSATIVLCGSQTYQRKFVDWEIKATLDCPQHALLGVRLPLLFGLQAPLPDRLLANWISGFARVFDWSSLLQRPHDLPAWVAEGKSKSRSVIQNNAALRARNG